MATFNWSAPRVVLSSASFDIAEQLVGPFNPVVQQTAEGYRMWMNLAFKDGTVEIWHGTSDDGLHYGQLRKAFGPEIFGGRKLRVGSPALLREGDCYRIWFYVFDGRHRRIYTGRSRDGLGVEAVELSIDVGACPPYDNRYTYNPFVLRDRRDGRLRMWRTGWEKWDTSEEVAKGLRPSRHRVIHCWSADGVNWQDHRMVIDMGAEGQHDVLASRLPGNVIQFADGTFELWYSGSYRDEEQDCAVWCIMHALSEDGLNWHSFSMEIPPGFEGGRDAMQSYSPFAIRQQGKVKLWYGGRNKQHQWCILYTEALT